MDIIFIEQLSVFTNIGVYDWEQSIQQKLLLDIKIGFKNKYLIKNNQAKCYLDYAKIIELVIGHIENKNFLLIEELAQEIADIILNKFNICWVSIKVSKPCVVARANQVSVIIKRTKESLG